MIDDTAVVGVLVVIWTVHHCGSCSLRQRNVMHVDGHAVAPERAAYDRAQRVALHRVLKQLDPKVHALPDGSPARGTSTSPFTTPMGSITHRTPSAP